jgi:lipid-A-disaccharide synthase
MIIAGEASGDLHASGLMREFRATYPDAHFFGVGGDQMEAQGCEAIYAVDQVAFLGLVEVIAHLPFIRKMMNRLLAECVTRKPRAIILVDYPGFNLKFAERIRQKPGFESIPILYYISPQVWAWHVSRVPRIAQLVDRIAVIFDFEVSIYKKAGLQADFVGHPLLEMTEPSGSKEEFFKSLGCDGDKLLLGLLPGSRKQEIRRLLPLFLETFALLKDKVPTLCAAVGCSPTVEDIFYSEIINKSVINNQVFLLRDKTNVLQAHSDVVLAASGTATLETAILGTPLVMAYKVAPLTYFIGKYLVKIPNIALVNVVAGKRVIPEFIQSDAHPRRIAETLYELLTNTAYRETMEKELKEVRRKLGEPGASRKVAAILNELIST